MPEETRSYLCPWCNRPTAGSVAGVAVWDGYDRSTRQPVNPPIEYALVQCGHCGQAVTQLREDYGRGFEDDEPTNAYPAPRRLSYHIPDELRREWQEATVCFDSKAYTATVIMVRRTLEGVCSLHGVKKKQRLVDGIAELKSFGLIDGTLAAWADALRVLGNEGAHYTGRPVSREDAEDSLDFAEALLDHLYVFRQRFEGFKARRMRSDDV